MPNALREELSTYLRQLANGKHTESEVLKLLKDLSGVLGSGCTDEAVLKSVRKSIKEDKQSHTQAPYDKYVASMYIYNSELPRDVKTELTSVITDSHSKHLVDWVISYLTKPYALRRQIADWFKYPQWRAPFSERVLSCSEVNSRTLLQMNPAMCEYFSLRVANSDFKPEIENLGSLGPKHNYILCNNSEVRDELLRKVGEASARKSGTVDAYTCQSIAHRLNYLVETTEIPKFVIEFHDKYFVPYSKLKEYKDCGAERYRNMSILDIWAEITGAEHGGD